MATLERFAIEFATFTSREAADPPDGLNDLVKLAQSEASLKARLKV